MDALETARRVYNVMLPPVVCTSNWGAGIFRGDAELKSLIQWLVFSVYGLRTIYCPFDNAALQQLLKDFSICCAARKQKITCGELGTFLTVVLPTVYRGRRGPGVVALAARHFGLTLSMAGNSLNAPIRMPWNDAFEQFGAKV